MFLTMEIQRMSSKENRTRISHEILVIMDVLQLKEYKSV